MKLLIKIFHNFFLSKLLSILKPIKYFFFLLLFSNNLLANNEDTQFSILDRLPTSIFAIVNEEVISIYDLILRSNFFSVSSNIKIDENFKTNILPELISKEPLGPLVRHGDDQWRDVVSWSLKVMIIAEELNISSKNIDEYLESDNNEILRLLGEVGSYGDMIELDEKWAYNIIKQVGNYKEIFNRNIGPNTLLNLNRGFNELYLKGGLLYAPPFR